MSEAPEGIWVFQNGLWSRDYENYHPEPTEYIRKDVSDALIAAAYVDAANLHQSLWRETSAYKTDQILKRTSTDTRQALDALLKAEREKALREAAATVQLGDTVQNIQRRILALVENPAG